MLRYEFPVRRIANTGDQDGSNDAFIVCAGLAAAIGETLFTNSFPKSFQQSFLKC